MENFYQICKECNSRLSSDEKAIYMKLIERRATEFLWLDCLGERLGFGRAAVEGGVRYYRESGNCVLFR